MRDVAARTDNALKLSPGALYGAIERLRRVAIAESARLSGAGWLPGGADQHGGERATRAISSFGSKF
jgi:hypothetical protein